MGAVLTLCSGLIQDDAVFINTARVAPVDQEALIEELSTGRFWAALDVGDPDPLPLEHPLRLLYNVLYTPHISGPTTLQARSSGLPVRNWLSTHDLGTITGVRFDEQKSNSFFGHVAIVAGR